MSKRKKTANGDAWLVVPAWEPRRRSWPYEPTRLEIIATRMGIDDEDLRELLRDEIERRRGPNLAQTSENQLT